MKKRMSYFLAVLALVMQLSGCSMTPPAQTFTPEGELSIHIIDAGNADCIYIALPNGKDMLIDGGLPASKEHILEYLEQIGAGKIDYCVATHPHNDHIGSLDDAIKEFGIGEMLMTRAVHNTAAFEKLLEAVEQSGAQVTEAVAGTTIFDEDGVSVYILSPTETRDLQEDLNDSSVVIRMVYHNTAFLFMGDAGKSVEQECLQSGENLKANVIKLGHHGSSTASTEAFMKRVDPDYAVITCGEGNSYGHPHAETMALMEAYQIPVYRSDEKGDIVFTSDGNTVSVETEK